MRPAVRQLGSRMTCSDHSARHTVNISTDSFERMALNFLPAATRCVSKKQGKCAEEAAVLRAVLIELQVQPCFFVSHVHTEVAVVVVAESRNHPVGFAAGHACVEVAAAHATQRQSRSAAATRCMQMPIQAADTHRRIDTLHTCALRMFGPSWPIAICGSQRSC